MDTECDLAIEVTHRRVREAIVGFLHRLLAEHLGVERKIVALSMEQTNGSLISTIENLQDNHRTLKPLADQIPPDVAAVALKPTVIDPEEPIDPDRLLEQLLPTETHDSARRYLTATVLTLLAIATLAALWYWTPLREWINKDALVNTIAALEHSPNAWLWVMGCFIVASLTVIPITALNIATVVIFGPIVGFAYAIAGSLLGAMLTFGLGQLIGRRTVARLAGSRINKISHRLGQHGVLAVLAVRVLPVAPFTIVNLVAGASHISLRDFLIGTVLGMAPGMIAIILFADRLAAVIHDPSPLTLAILVGAVAIIVAGAFFIRSRLRRIGGIRTPEHRRNA